MTDIATLIRQVAKKNGLTPAQTAVLLAGAKVESGLNPGAVGDNGTSFGLYQMHIGGAGGKTEAEARRYLDPVTAITNRARFVKAQNITDGAGFAALQRPADPKGYAAKVNAALGGGGGGLNAPVTGGTPALGMGAELPGLPAAPVSDPFSARLSGLASSRGKLHEWIGGDDKQDAAPAPSLRDSTSSLRSARDMYEQANAAMTAAANAPAAAVPGVPGAAPTGPNVTVATDGGKNTYQQILKLGNQFGLRIDGSNQTTGGSHADGSFHYQGRAVDFGDAKNSPEKLRALAAWARRNAPRIKELYFNPLGWGIENGKIVKGLTMAGHDDHLHIAM